ncbi:MAG TPA: cofactor-independent phosphoglycerate mutase [Chthonomonadales bacterium]|nr:cofactor-independent phosphoglycerate mutase [Chthonomonadales bacterium]
MLLVPDGMADDPVLELGGRTPLEAASTPTLDRLARHGEVGSVQVTPPGMYPGSDAANMALMGYDPREYYTGRGPVEAAAMGVAVGARDVAFRCSIVTTDGERLTDYCAGHITTPEAHALLEHAASRIGEPRMRFCPGVSYRHVIVVQDGSDAVTTHEPHENMGRPIREMLPAGADEALLRRLILSSLELLSDHPVNVVRRERGLPPGNLLWPWGQGRTPVLPPFKVLHGVTGAVVAGVDVVKGLGMLAGLEVLDVPGVTGDFDNDYVAQGTAAAEALRGHDFVLVHVEAPDEAGHVGSIAEKVRALESVDSLLLEALLKGLRGVDFRLLVVPDHATPVATRGHRAGWMPYLLYGSDETQASGMPFHERAAMASPHRVEEGRQLIGRLLRG